MTTSRVSRESWCWLVVAVVAAIADGWSARAHLNPDGAAYLDLADALRRGDWPAFVQGYWSPLYPALAAVAQVVSRALGVGELAAVHALNVLLVIVGAFLVHRLVCALYEGGGEGSVLPPVFWVRGSWATYLLCAIAFVRVDAVTPDTLLLAVIVGAGSEWLRRGATRPWRLGIWLGLAFLAKTSSWPWLLVAWTWLLLPWSGRSRAQGMRAVVLGPVITLALTLLWLVPLSLKAGRPTLGSTGRLNACWFIRGCDGRSPDTHRGRHDAYATVTAATGASVPYARFAGHLGTYPPWSDPTAWATGVRSQQEEPTSLARWLSVAVRNFGNGSRYVGLYLYLGVLAPLALWFALSGVRLTRASLAASGKGGAVSGTALVAASATLLGVVGIAQFVAVQLQPRLIAPFAWLHVTGVLALALHARAPRGRRQGAAAWVAPLSMLTLAAPLVLATMAIRGDARFGASLVEYRATLSELSRRANGGVPPSAVLVVGEAFPLVSHARALGLRIVAQVLPGGLPALDALPPSERQRQLQQVAAGAADVAWQVQGDGRVRVTALR